MGEKGDKLTMKTREEIYKQKTLDAATNMILTKLEELRGDKAENKELKRRRWIWELIQNANDCSNGKPIDISIDTDDNAVVFSHNGSCFTYENLIDLITQISTKIKDEEKIGKFGTGFISTHLISEVVEIQGLYHKSEESKEYKKLNLILDRSGCTAEEISEEITKAFKVLESLESSPDVNYDDKITTSFIYRFNSNRDVQEAISKGFLDWERTIPFVLAFSDNIRSVRFNDIEVRKECLPVDGKICNVWISFYKDKKEIKRKYVSSIEQENVRVACVVNFDIGILEFEDMKNYPKLFYTFPLVGTENFPFPIVINSKRFHVSQERNSIHESVPENIDVINCALELYKEFIDYWISYQVEKFFNLCKINEDPTRSAFLDEYGGKVRAIYKHARIVSVISNANEEGKESLIDENNKKNIIIPLSDQDQDVFWQIVHRFAKKSVPKLQEVSHWGEVCPENTITISKFITLFENPEKTSEYIERTGQKEFLEITNKLNELCFDEQKKCFKNVVSYLNQNMKFLSIDKLMIDDEIDDELKEILMQLGYNIKEKLIHRSIKVYNQDIIAKYTNEMVANEICNIIRKNLARESEGDTRTEELQIIYNQLTCWFINHNQNAKRWFADIYEKQHLLTKPEETVRRLKLANDVENIMKRNGIDFKILNEIVDRSGQLLQMIENGEEGVSPELKELLKHISKNNSMSAEYFNKIMSRSIANVHDELVKNPYYEVDDDLDDWKKNSLSSTVFVAQKNSREIHIIVRPSDNSKIIFYEDTEFEALDECESELWTDDGNGNVVIVTMGDLLKTTGITMIPLKKIV